MDNSHNFKKLTIVHKYNKYYINTYECAKCKKLVKSGGIKEKIDMETILLFASMGRGSPR